MVRLKHQLRTRLGNRARQRRNKQVRTSPRAPQLPQGPLHPMAALAPVKMVIRQEGVTKAEGKRRIPHPEPSLKPSDRTGVQWQRQRQRRRNKR